MKFFIFSLGAILLISSISAKLYDFSEKGWGGDCVGGMRQSPINFPSDYTYNTTDYLKIISTEYKIISNLSFSKEPVDMNKYHIMNLTQDYGSMMIKKDGVNYKYNLLDVHFHILAEHTFGGKAYESEMHMVHIKDMDYLKNNNITETEEDKVNKYLVVGTVLTVDGTMDNTDLKKMNIGKGVNIDNLDLKVFSKPDMSFYHYIGGLTSPDCNQVVNWVVNSNIVKISAAQSNAIRQWITPVYPNGNTRAVQNLNNRILYKCEAAVTPVVPMSSSAGFLKGNIMMLISALILALFL